MKNENNSQQLWNTLRERWILSARSKEKRRDLIIKNERGNVTLLLLVIFVGGILISLVFFDLFSIFVHRRMAQTGADAAALAAAMEMRKVYEEKLKEEIDSGINQLIKEVNEKATQIHLDSFVPEEYDEDGKLISDEYYGISFEEAKQQVLNDLRGEGVPSTIVDPIDNPQLAVDAAEAILYFNQYNHSIVTEMICSHISTKLGGGQQAAQHFAQANGIEDEVEIQFIPEDFVIYVVVKSKPTFTTIDQQPFENNRVHSSAAASIPFPDGIVFEQSYCN